MKSEEQIKERALNEALAFFFCNVDDEDWPADPMALLNEGRLVDGDKQMTVWQPFENTDLDELVDMIESSAQDYEDCMKWAQKD